MLVCTACNLASPVITGFLFEMLAGRGRSMSQYPVFFAVFAVIYVVEPLLTRIYVKQVCAAAEKVPPLQPMTKRWLWYQASQTPVKSDQARDESEGILED